MNRSKHVLVLLALQLFALGAQAAELVMFERTGCVWCRRWDLEVGAIYQRSPEGQRVPLRRASLDQALPPELRLSPPVFYSPTFVLMEKGREIGRITGYQGEEAFWGLLGVMLRKAEETTQ
jgi:thioredoxin-related protein